MSTSVEPPSSPAMALVKGPLWYSGPGMSSVPPGRCRHTMPPNCSTTPVCAETISLGRPVLPPEAGAL